MKIDCLLGLHRWEGCQCIKCAKVRNEAHDWKDDCEKCSRCGQMRQNFHSWDGCKCSTCGKIRAENHDWSQDCEKCSRCGQRRQNAHNWIACKCSVCGKVRDEEHDWTKDCEECCRCGKTRSRTHDWSQDCEKCFRCGKTRENPHTWKYNCEKCFYCAQTRANLHVWDRCKCSKCGTSKPGDEEHDWSKDCGTCAYCGKLRNDAHNWDGFKCTRCGCAITGFAKGDRVCLSKYLGCWKLTTNGITREIHFNSDQVGTVIAPLSSTGVVVLWDAQKWDENLCGGHKRDVVSLPAFEMGIAVDYLEKIREGDTYVGTSSYRVYHGISNIKIELLDGGEAVMYEDGGKNGYYRRLGNKLKWKQSGEDIWIAFSDKEPALSEGFNGKIEGDYIRGTKFDYDGKPKWDWVLEREKKRA